MEYSFKEIEQKWQKYWVENKTYEVKIDKTKPKFYVLDMFPYPSGAGLHVGHPLGYIASDIYSRFKRLQGFNVLHPMGYDAFGLPAEQYAIQTGQHPAKTTKINSARYREQLDKIGFSYDWSREVATCDPEYYKWTQWIFQLLFKHAYNNTTEKAISIEEVIKHFEKHGTDGLDLACTDAKMQFTANDWENADEATQQDRLMNYRLAFQADTMVNWCEALGTVLANDEVKDGLSARGDHPVVQRKMKQWLLRVSAYAKRLLDGLDTLEWTDSLKEIQRNWIGFSEGAEVWFPVKGSELKIQIFTTRPDTIFGATFMVLAPESELVKQLTTSEYKEQVENYIVEVQKRTERERMSDVKTVSGQFTGSYALNPFNGEPMPIYIADYVLAGYGTGAIMAVPAHDSRDFAFAKHFNLPIIPVIEASNVDLNVASYDAKEGKMINSEFINGLEVKDAVKKTIAELEAKQIGNRKINYRLRDAIFSRQRYWGEPFPVYFKNGIPYLIDEKQLPLELPEIDEFKPTATGQPPLGRAKNWQTPEGYPLELSTMPGFAGSSAYYLRYMDPRNNEQMFSPEAVGYWENVDLYIGGTEHAVGHLIYSRFWNKFLFDLGYTVKDEPFKKLVNQGMIQGRSNFVYRVVGTNKFVSLNLKKNYQVTELHVDINIVRNDVLDTEAFKKWNPEYANAEFILENDQYICGWAVEKMSKSMFNVVNPDDVISAYGADTLRLYEMFLGPIEQSKPWDMGGIEGVHRFLKKTWRLFFDKNNVLNLSDEAPTADELKILHKTIKKIADDIERFSFNTSVSAFMICVNDLATMQCNKKVILQDLAVLLAPFAPHIAEELWAFCGNTGSVVDAKFPIYNPDFVAESTITYPVSFNGKTRFNLDVPADMPKEQVEKAALADERSEKWLEGKAPKKIIVVPGRIINIVV